ncbi:zyxin-like [Mobula hypostoma]|uniref:zyxin-like n=1 Tax=Mobula hypostoma TaxID=723540 RepID=UPI002FC39362
MSAPGEGGQPRAATGVKFSLAAPSSFTPQRKYGPVVAPKPKVNPYRVAGAQPEGPVAVETRVPGANTGQPRTAKVDVSLSVALPPPPPPEDEALPAPCDLPPPSPPPPPPPPPPFEESFPAPPLEDAFPSPPSPMVEETLSPGEKTASTAQGSVLPSVESTLESEIDTLTNLLNDMERNDPRRPRAEVPAPPTSTQTGSTLGKPPPSVTTLHSGASHRVPGAKFNTRAQGFPPATAPKPQAPLPKAQVCPKAPTPVVREQERAREVSQTPRKRETIEPPRPAVGVQGASPLSYKDVQELETLAQDLIREMDKHPEVKTGAAELCGQCGRELSRSQAAVKAMGRLFHVECFTCSQCRAQLQGRQFYEVEGRPLCESCHQETLEKCSACGQPIHEKMLRATGKAFHPECFTCGDCGQRLEGRPFLVDPEGKVYCVEDYHRRFAPRCSVCQQPIIPEEGREETVRIVALERNFHLNCYRCEDCGTQLSTEADEKGCYPLDSHVLCIACHTARLQKSRP